jgi:uncharacterized protein (DUF1330 family)
MRTLVATLALAFCAACANAQTLAGTAPTTAPAAPAAEAPAPRKAYMVVLGTVTDREAFARGYAARLPPLYERFGGRYLAVGRVGEMLEGQAQASSYVLSEWPSIEAARAFWNSPEYDELRRARIEGGWGTFTVYLFEGIPPTTIAPMAREAVPTP